MGTTKPIKTLKEIEAIKEYFLTNQKIRDFTLFTLCINTAMRISDVLSLTWGDVYNYKTGVVFSHITLKERKTGKLNCVQINKNANQALCTLFAKQKNPRKEDFIFKSRKGTNQAITRNRAYVIFAQIAKLLPNIEKFSCHSLRKTFGYHAYKTGCPSVLLMSIFNHSSFSITKRYLGIQQEEKDAIFKNLLL